MPASVIGKSLNLGYAGNISRNDPKTTVVNRPVGTGPVLFGVPVKLNSGNSYDPLTGSDADTTFAGIALRNVKQQTVYLTNAAGQYNQNEACDVLTVGYVTVAANHSAALTAGGPVFAVFDGTGKFLYFDVTAATTPNTSTQIKNAQWAQGGSPDANDIAELALLTPAKA